MAFNGPYQLQAKTHLKIVILNGKQAICEELRRKVPYDSKLYVYDSFLIFWNWNIVIPYYNGIIE